MSVRSFILTLSLAALLPAQENHITLTFDELPELIEKSSSQMSIIRAQNSLKTIQADKTLQWSNPEINYQREYIENNGMDETEHVMALSKSFSMPWIYWQQRGIARENLQAANLAAEQKSKELLSQVRSGYVKLSLLRKLTDYQMQLKDVLKNLKQIILSQNEEGNISLLNAQLMSLSLFGLDCEIVNTQKENHRAESHLKQLLGIEVNNNIVLNTSVGFTEPSENYMDQLKATEEHSGLKALGQSVKALERGINLERSRIIPSFVLQGGIKRINPGWEGFTLGVSVPLPFFNWNGAEIQEQKIQHSIHLSEYNLYKQEISSKTEYLVKTIEAYSELLKEQNAGLDGDTVIKELSAAYKEGSLSLSEFLNTILIYRDGARNYSEHLIEYYQAIFELEALHGLRLVIL